MVLNHYRRAPRRLIMLDFDGTLVPLVDDPRRANPTPALLKTLVSLAADPANELVLISGRDRATLHEWFANLPVGLAAEHGAWRKKRSQQWTLARNLSCDWKPKLSPMMIQYADRLPGAFVEEKEFSLVWHYRRADSEQGMVVARELMDDLLLFTGNIDVKVVQGNKTVEVRSSGLAKSLAARTWLRDGEFDFILAVGDDHDDEELFGVLPQQAYSIRVGITQTAARFNLREPREVVTLLEALTEAHALTRRAASPSGPLG
jgi:trehalose 6-phosphate synthase/phosphatase